jgi:DnaJ-class molecular chaperone
MRSLPPPGGRLCAVEGLAEVGDQIVELRIVVPASLSEAEQALYRRLLELQTEAEAADP